MAAYPYLFAPGYIGALRVKNRIIMAAVATNFTGDQGGVTERLVNFYAERAKGGAGVVIVENTNVDFPEGTNGATQLRLDEDRFIPGLNYLAEAIKRGGARAVLQLNHGGPTSKSAKIGGLQPVGPAAVNWPPLGEMPRPLSKEEIARIAAKFAAAAARAKKAAFDGIEIHGGHSYLLSSFISPYTNRRTDEFGGSIANRMRFPRTVVEMVRAAVGPGFPVFFRYSADEFLPGGLALEDGIAAATILAEAGVDLISVSAGGRSSVCQMIEPMSYEEGWRTYLAAAVKKEVSVPVATGGNIKTPAVAERAIAEGNADYVALARALIADPLWPEKAFHGEALAINRCVSCNVGCSERRMYRDLPIACTVNPRVGWEGQASRRAASKRRVLVVGGGPAGMEAAATLGERGHTVLLVEKQDRLGGQLRLAGVAQSKQKLNWFLQRLDDRVRGSGVEIQLSTRADKALVESYAPDVVILATGSTPLQPFPPGERLRTAREVFAAAQPFSGKSVAVIGGGSVGCECAEYLADAGNTVTILEMTDSIAADLDFISRVDQLDRLAKLPVQVLASCRVQSTADGAITFEENGTLRQLLADFVVVAVGARADCSLEGALRELAITEYYVVGDADRPAKLIDAVAQARAVAERI